LKKDCSGGWGGMVSEGGGLGGKDEGRKKERKNGILIRGVDSGVERKERRETKKGGGEGM
jgi:hypothetical protein